MVAPDTHSTRGKYHREIVKSFFEQFRISQLTFPMYTILVPATMGIFSCTRKRERNEEDD